MYLGISWDGDGLDFRFAKVLDVDRQWPRCLLESNLLSLLRIVVTLKSGKKNTVAAAYRQCRS